MPTLCVLASGKRIETSRFSAVSSETDDVVALWRLQSAYADVITRRAFDELDALFVRDAPIRIDTVTAPPRRIIGSEAFGQFVAQAIERYDHFAFVILNTVVDLDPSAPDRATGRIFMCEIRHDRTTDTWQNAHGRYEDEYVRLDGRWRFAARSYRSMARTGPDGIILGLPADDPTPPMTLPR